eukprot:TRINITY_DN3148_c0_g1_i2.p1 TRINITY_DN3148_c0_g1~~TRINITY_DN3148_c0_g1_i2.p1  ORF type:complete len:269 (+),score=67.61 TRINITY_DN3148_c0_g1_i2:121-927(+)
MFHLLYGLWRSFFRKDEYRILLTGLDNAGKTTLLERVKTLHGIPGLPSDKIAPTVGLNLGRIELRRCRILIWDLGGMASLRPIWRKYYAQTHALVFVCDASLPRFDARWREVRACLRDILSAPQLGDVPLLILANKQDCTCALTAQEVFDLLTDYGEESPRPQHPVVGTAADTASPNGVSHRRGGGAVSPAAGLPPAVVSGGQVDSPLAAASPSASVDGGAAAVSLSSLLDGRAAYRVAPACARDGTGVAEGLDWLVSLLLLKARTVD